MGSKRKYKKHRTRVQKPATLQLKPAQEAVVAKLPTEQSTLARPGLTERMLARINRLTHWQAAAILFIVGFGVFATGFMNPFERDDFVQIVDNIPVHSISHVALLFNGGTSYAGHGLAPLVGSYYRPLMMVFFSLIYTLFGAHTFPFHLVQIFLVIANAILVYLVFKRMFHPLLALTLALIFLVHPLNSQVAFSIPNLQDAQYFFFGMLSFYLLISLDEKRHVLDMRLWLIAGCLFLSLLSKEAGGMFIAVDALYLCLTNRDYLKRFLLILILPVLVYLALKMHAVGLSGTSDLAPLEKMGLSARLLSAPSIMLFYLAKFVFPLKLASGYFWAYSSFSFQHVVLPLAIDIAIVGVVVYLACIVKRRGSGEDYRNFIFFALWAGLGIVVFLQIFPMDFTASEAWFYFGMVGWLGMMGVLMLIFQDHLRPGIFAAVVIGLVCLLGIRTVVRGTEWSSIYNLAKHDVVASKGDFDALNDLSYYYTTQQNYTLGEQYADASINIMPNASNYGNLAVDLQYLGQNKASYSAYLQSLDYGAIGNNTADNFATLLMTYGNYGTNAQIFHKLINTYPTDAKLWSSLAVLNAVHGNEGAAKTDIIQASHYGSVSPSLYKAIMAGKTE